MQKHGKDPDYPSVLDTYGLPAMQARCVDVQSKASITKLAARKAASDARANETQLFALLEKLEEQLVAAYGKRSAVLYDYGFRPVLPRKPAVRRTKARAATGASSGSGSPESGTPSAGGSSSSSPSAVASGGSTPTPRS